MSCICTTSLLQKQKLHQQKKSIHIRFTPCVCALSACYKGLGIAHLRLNSQMRCSHLAVFVKLSAKNRTLLLCCVLLVVSGQWSVVSPHFAKQNISNFACEIYRSRRLYRICVANISKCRGWRPRHPALNRICVANISSAKHILVVRGQWLALILQSKIYRISLAKYIEAVGYIEFA